jgi:hypothetical protein
MCTHSQAGYPTLEVYLEATIGGTSSNANEPRYGEARPGMMQMSSNHGQRFRYDLTKINLLINIYKYMLVFNLYYIGEL